MRLLLLPLFLLLAGCNGSKDFTCSSQAVIEKVGEVYRGQLAKHPQMVIFDPRTWGSASRTFGSRAAMIAP
jgi:hypothetical protein